MAQHNELGQWGEQLAREYLVTHGYKVMEHNAHVGHKEIDIVATRGNRMVFVEVKTRRENLGEALDAVDAKKIRRLVRAANSFLQRFNAPWEYQFDIIAVIGTPQAGHTLHHYPDAFFPPLE
ncbi:MAG: YraN family protein [Firmicutes bacterium]|nr:YraN family protein [Bacillota bacterium]MCM1401819.1 YraN family protein [Bacteroides sp.]MCM1477945.1 YraN family protein [Bacteroides sp.]